MMHLQSKYRSRRLQWGHRLGYCASSAMSWWRWLRWCLRSGLSREGESRREHRHTIGKCWHWEWEATRHTKSRNWRHRGRSTDVGVLLLAILMSTVISVSSTAMTGVLIVVAVAIELRTTVAALVGSQTSTDGFGGYTLTDLDVRLFNDHAGLHGLSTAASILGAYHPLPISISKFVDWNNADTGLVVAAFTWTKSNAPSRPQLRIWSSVLLHGILSGDGILSTDHLHKSMAFVLVDYACLHSAELREEISQLLLRRRDTTDKESTAQHFDTASWDGGIMSNPFLRRAIT